MSKDTFLASLPNDSMVISRARPLSCFSNDVSYPYHPCRQFLYLSGLNTDNATFIQLHQNNKWRSHLFLPTKDLKKLLWEGNYLYHTHPEAESLADHVHSLDQLEEWLCSQDCKIIYCDSQDKYVNKLIESHPGQRRCYNPALYLARISKSAAEIASLRTACQISATCHNDLMRYVQPGMNEREIEGYFFYRGTCYGVRQPAYPAIVAGGSRANTLHYTGNNNPINDGELLLIDAGWIYQGMCADVTRTYPVNGKFSSPQKDLYQLVLHAQTTAIAAIKPGATIPDLNKKACSVLAEGLYQRGFFNDLASASLGLKNYFPHGLGHWLGLDVHDPCPYTADDKQPIKLATDMTLTIEPGLYIPSNDQQAPKEYRGIGIRIEDDCLVTHSGCEVLTDSAIKQIDAIEAMMS